MGFKGNWFATEWDCLYKFEHKWLPSVLWKDSRRLPVKQGKYRLNTWAMALRQKGYTKQPGRHTCVRLMVKLCCRLEQEKVYLNCPDADLLVTARSKAVMKTLRESPVHSTAPRTRDCVSMWEVHIFQCQTFFMLTHKSCNWFINCATANTSAASSYRRNAPS